MASRSLHPFSRVQTKEVLGNVSIDKSQNEINYQGQTYELLGMEPSGAKCRLYLYLRKTFCKHILLGFIVSDDRVSLVKYFAFSIEIQIFST